VAPSVKSRRPIPSRNTGWARAIAASLVRLGIHPNAISASSVVWAAATAVLTLWAARHGGAPAAAAYVVAAVAILLRLLANLFDGMVAVEGGKGSKSGEVWNELPDRVSDALVLVAAGHAVGGRGEALGWLAAVLAVSTAYVRVLGTSAGAPADFRGPMAKQQRMAVLGAGLIAAAIEVLLATPARALEIALAVIIAGSFLTVWRRTRGIVRALEAR
jgi:CDP-diacylglycerol--glycerol-3-phosphate 3-phosphatidyltransferase